MALLSRRQFATLASCAAVLGCCAGLSPRTSCAEEATAAALADAQAQYEAVQAQIDELAWEYQQLSQELDATLGAIEAKNIEIGQTQEQIEATKAQLAAEQEELATYVSNSYKHGTTTPIDVVLNSADFEELFRNIYYLNKVSDAEAELIAQIKDTQAQLEAWETELEAQLAELEDLKAQQEDQLAQMLQRQNDAYNLLSSLDEQVQALTEQYNQELIAQAQAAAEAVAAAEAAAAAQTSGSYGGTSASAVLSCCNSTPSPGAGYCAAWVTNVFTNAGIGYFGGDACDMYASWCYSSDQGSIQPGMIVAVSSHPHTSAGQIYGHVGIYVGGSTVMDNIGYIRTIDLGSWISYYGSTVTPRWGWLGGVTLS